MDIHDAPAQDAKLIDDTETDTPHAPYRPPEAVIEPEEEHPPGYVPGVVEGYVEDDDFIMPVSPLRNVHDLPDTAGISHWQSSVRGYSDDRMDLDEGPSRMERPQIGPGILPRRWLQLVHGHELIQPHINELPQPPAKKPQPPASEDPNTQTPADIPTSPLTATKSAIEPSLPDYERICTQADVWDACPGGEEGHGDWYFCGTCWGWIRIVARHGDLPEVDDMEQWEAIIQSGLSEGLTYPGITTVDDIPAARSKRHAEYARLKDLKSAIPFADPTEHHLHEFQTLLYPTREKRLDRIPNDHVDDNAFPHLEMASLIDPAWESFDVPNQPSRLFVSCSSDWWIQVDDLIPGQLPKALALAFSSEKCANPGPGIEGKQSVADAWNMLIL
jgi:ubiquitin carboxyl-terminal hydrolase 25/28